MMNLFSLFNSTFSLLEVVKHKIQVFDLFAWIKCLQSFLLISDLFFNEHVAWIKVIFLFPEAKL